MTVLDPRRTSAPTSPRGAIFAAAFAFGLALGLSAPLGAQAVGAGSATHTVVRGETLGSIAQMRLGSVAAWTLLLELNRDQITNPNLILPGQVLRLPASASASTSTSTSTAADTVPGDYRARQALVARTPFQPNPAPEPAPEDRTLFYGASAPGASEPLRQVVVAGEEARPIVNPGLARSAPWFAAVGAAAEPWTAAPAGEIEGFMEARTLRLGDAALLPGEEVRIRLTTALGAGATPPLGSRLTAYREEDAGRRVGVVRIPTGELEVLGVLDDGRLHARLVAAFDAVLTGQPVLLLPEVEIPMVTRELRADALAGALPLAGQVLARVGSGALHRVGDPVILDRGGEDGVRLGDRFVVDGGEGEATVALELEVVRVQPQVATARVTRVLQPRALQPGTGLRRIASP